MEKLIICHNLQIKDLHKKLKNYNSYVKILTNKKNKEYNNINKVWNKLEIKLEVSYIFYIELNEGLEK
jgi:hypothetical protein